MPAIDAKIQRMRHEDYSQRRHDLMKEVREARSHISRTAGSRGRKAQRSPTNDAAAVDRDASTAAQIEARRLQKTQQKQQREIEQMLAFEIKQAERQDEAARKLFAEQDREKRMAKARLSSKKKGQEARRLRDLKQRAERLARHGSHLLYFCDVRILALF